VLVPERSVFNKNFDYLNQVDWENTGTENCKVLLFWVPRDLVAMPAFTTNVEFGRYVASGKVTYGRPDSAPNNRYLDWLYKKYNTLPIFSSLEQLVDQAVEIAENH
jgi:hypothetical protein